MTVGLEDRLAVALLPLGQWLTAAEAAAYLGLHISTVYEKMRRFARDGLLREQETFGVGHGGVRRRWMRLR